VWIGNDDNTPMVHATGGTLPARIFHAFMTDAEGGLPVRPLAGSLAIAAADPTTAATLPDGTQPETDPNDPAPAPKKPGTIEDLINGILGK
jgi:penicillin-binding protein 1A